MNLVVRICPYLIVAGAVAGCSRADSAAREILFQALAADGTEDIYALDFGTGKTRRLTRGAPEYANSFPVRSPTDDVIAFVRQFGDRDELLLLDPAGGGERTLEIPGQSALGPPAWSPDGETILIAAGSNRQALELHQFDVRAASSVELTMTDGSYDCGTYSPDGRRIVASRQAPPLSEVVILDRITRDQRVLASADTVAFHCPEWSPLGDAIAVAVYRRNPARASIVLLDTATGGLHPVVTGSGVSNAPRWSRAGDWIIYQCSEMPSVPDDREGAAAFYRSMEICAVRPDGRDRRQLTDNDHFDAHPSW